MLVISLPYETRAGTTTASSSSNMSYYRDPELREPKNIPVQEKLKGKNKESQRDQRKTIAVGAS